MDAAYDEYLMRHGQREQAAEAKHAWPQRSLAFANGSISSTMMMHVHGATDRCLILYCRQYAEDVEEGLDAAYDEYLMRHGQREQAAEAKRARLQKTPRGLDGQLIEDDEDAATPAEAAAPAAVVAPAHEVQSWLRYLQRKLPDVRCWQAVMHLPGLHA